MPMSMAAAQREAESRARNENLKVRANTMIDHQAEVAITAGPDNLVAKVRVEQALAKAVLLKLPAPKTYEGRVYHVDATCKGLGAGVHELTFFVVDGRPPTQQ